MSITAAAAGRGTTGSLSLPWIIAASRLFCGHAYRRLGQREPYPRVGFIVTNLTRSAESRRRPIDTPTASASATIWVIRASFACIKAHLCHLRLSHH
jgi:hypothetical protein